MFMPGRIEEISNPTGTLHVRLVFGRRRIYAGEETPRLPASITVLAAHSRLPYQCPEPSTVASWHLELGIEIQVYRESLTVRTLYDGLLVTVWTTAQKIPQHRCWSCSARLAAILVLLAALTAVGRCYGEEAPLSHLSSDLQSPLHYSKFPTSNLVLSRLFRPGRLRKSDTRVIRDDSETRNRREREVKPAQRNRIADLKTKSASEENSTTFKNSNGESFSLRTSKIFGHIDDPKSELSALIGNVSEGASESVNATRVTKTNNTEAEAHQNDKVFYEEGGELLRSTQRPMPPAHAHDNESSGAVSAFGIILVVVLLTGAVLGLVTCLLSHQRGTGGASGAGTPATHPHHAADSPTTAPMLSVVSAGAAAGMGGMDRLRGGRATRELATTRDRQVRLHAVHTDIAINLPHSIAMPDGEEHPFTTSRLHIRDAEQESEIYQKCIRPPPNRTVLESESPPPYRSSSAGVLASSSSSSSGSSSGGSDWSAGSAPLVVRCHSMSSTSKPLSTSQKTDFLQRTVKIFTGKRTQHHQPPPAPTLPVVAVPPTRSRRADPGRPKPPPPAV